jgi:hypothetical protein
MVSFLDLQQVYNMDCNLYTCRLHRQALDSHCCTLCSEPAAALGKAANFTLRLLANIYQIFLNSEIQSSWIPGQALYFAPTG